MRQFILKLCGKLGIDIFYLLPIYRTYHQIIGYIKYRDAFMFRAVAIEVSSYCNRKCSYCPVSKEEEKIPKMFMEMDLFKKIIGQLQDMNFKGSIMYHFYNEPLLDERLPEFISYTSKNLPKSMSRVFTSGDFLTPKLADTLFDAGLFDMVVTDHNIKPGRVAKRIAPILEKYGDRISMNRLYEKPLQDRANSVELGEIKVQKSANGHCQSIYEELNIMYDGDVILCSSDYYRTKVFGNVNSNSILDIYRTDEFKSARSEIIAGKPYYEICRTCSSFIGDRNAVSMGEKIPLNFSS
jgi:GTP 3',8-cyclase